MLAVLAFVGSLATAAILLLGSRRMLEASSLMRANYRGREIPCSAGILFVPAYLIVFAVISVVQNVMDWEKSAAGLSLLVLVIGMGFFGFVDDVMGEGGARGFKGHFLALFRGQITTGSMKAAGCFLVALMASLPFCGPLWELLLDAVLIALFANTFNLLDVRPGRAIKVFIPALVGVATLNWRHVDEFLPYALAIGAVAVVLLPGDLSERFMLGDAGSNILGATIGLGLVQGAGNWWKLGFVIFLILLNLLSEKFSFTRVIEANVVLNWLDSIGRKG